MTIEVHEVKEDSKNRSSCLDILGFKNRGGLVLLLALMVGWADAMPTKEALKAAEPTVQELMAPELKLLKSGEKKPMEAAAAVFELARQTENEAAKLLIYRGALNLFARAGDADKCVKVLKTIRGEISDLSVGDLSIYAEDARKTFRKSNPRARDGALGAACAEARLRTRAEADLKDTCRALKKTPDNPALLRRQAEMLAVCGEWDKALEVFAKLGAKAAKAVESETTKTDLPAAADFWYDYKPMVSSLKTEFRRHAAKLYARCIEDDLLKGPRKTRAERRVAEAGPLAARGLFAYEPVGVQLWENGPYWAECNVGAEKPEDAGYYFWWGDTVGYKRNAGNNGWVSVVNGATFLFSDDNCPTYNKTTAQLQSAGYIDSTGNLAAAHDAATAHLGAPWRMPTDADFSALISGCTMTCATRNGVHGWLVTGKGAYASRSIFLPTTGDGYKTGIGEFDTVGFYWSSSSDLDNSSHAWSIFSSYHPGDIARFHRHNFYRQRGRPVRPLREFTKTRAEHSVSEAGQSTASGLLAPKTGGVQLWKNGPYWAECNVGAEKPEDAGYYFWWGDTVGYKRNAGNNGWVSVVNGATFLFSEDNCPTYNKTPAQLQSAGYIDSTGNLVAAHDAATAHLGALWHMPTDAELKALLDNCTTTWTNRNGVSGCLLTGKGAFATKSIFLPATGRGNESRLLDFGDASFCWSSSPLLGGDSRTAWDIFFLTFHSQRSPYHRCGGHTVRPLREFAK